ncbi:hypothetical protein B0H63DRAFT_565724 [Podospora didyma]|uniref:NACHT domain-containing protein n=1 Tax=Podospora didyma TaxID=330526 RepID=A0AAE0N3A4_9PEZI|nr:hypothetical protein B0H63DRAFT_565724 [Podospora didyma]
MDPLSVGLGIAGILPLIAQAIKCAKDYKDTVASAKASVAALIGELEALQFNVTNLHHFLKADAFGSNNTMRFQQTSVLLVCSASCETKLKALCRSLSEEESGRRNRFLWPFSEKEHQKTLQELRSFTTWMHFALSVDGCRLLSQTSDDVLKILGSQLEQFAAIQSLQRATEQVHNTVQAHSHMLERSQAQKARRDILDWISTANTYHQKHQDLQSSRTRDTGKWLLRSEEYSRWRNGPDQMGAFWCHGIQGSGKTNLVSIIVDDLRGLQQPGVPPATVAFFYFSHLDRLAQSPYKVLSCVLRQFLEQLDEIPRAVRAVYETAHTKGALPHFQCESLLVEILKDPRRSYLVLDALDECSEEHRSSILRTLAQIDQSQGARILITSRPHINEIPATLANLSTMKIVAHDSDIELYIRRELLRKGGFGLAGNEFVEEVVQRLSAGAEGMFLLPVLQLRTVLKEPSLGDMEDSLDRLSHNLFEAFEETIGRIQSLSANQQYIGMGVLMYLAHAAGPITVDELSDLLAIHPLRTRVAPKYRPTAKTLLECCQGLITIDSRTGDVRISHYSIQEYLVENDERLFPQGAEAILTVNCLRYLLLDDFAEGPWETEEQVDSYLGRYPFLKYAALFWGQHAKPSEGNPDVQAELARFFASKSAMAVANQVRQYALGRRWEYWGPKEALSFTALHHATRHGLTQTVKGLLDRAIFDVNITTMQGATPIIHAASNGHVDILRSLLQKGADPYLHNWYGDALHCAVEGNQAGTVRELVCWGMNPSGLGPGPGPGGPPTYIRGYIDCALDCDAAASFEALVELGVDINNPNNNKLYIVRKSENAKVVPARGNLGSAKSLPLFFQACSLGCEKIVGVMVDRGWVNVNMKSEVGGMTALHYAVEGRSLAVIQKLVDAGADIHAMDKYGISAVEDCLLGDFKRVT